MSSIQRILICAVGSIIAHVTIARALDELPPRVDLTPRKFVVRVIENPPVAPPPELEPPPEPEPTPVPAPEPKRPIERPQVTKVRAAETAPVAKDTPADRTPTTTNTTDEPTFGVSMESTSTVGSGPAMKVGNTAKQIVGDGSATLAPKQLAAPVAAYEATKLPLPQGRCSGAYTEEAKAAGIEGTVVLDLVVGADGKATEITLVSGLGHGLDQAAIEAIRQCRFTPGEQAGKPVAVHVRGFKIRFVMTDTSP
jgi:protein TonB